MPDAFILTTVDVRDPAAFAAYRTAISGLNDRIGGEMLVRGRTVETLAGAVENAGGAGEIVILIRFPNADAARAYIASPDYQAAQPLRDAAGRFHIRLVA
ncbi:DUF1330 domain-containing protein [Sphingobium sufflavum]|uniref:DUF1330 domain-containing protein n=1 Tax=Sphingobium sufflavum TaxID=1129547 RepID=UPI001F282EA7|nr:DUF1330 domain-containing protein [Sphingobium sufflavum]MCE7796255.1 DUF1330 domain-containing protein [Sphingobium sufflavum]